MTADEHVAAVRRFNRFYTQRIRVLDQGYLQSAFSLAEVRVLYEIAHSDCPAAVDLCRDLGLDPGYSSRILRRLEKLGLVGREPAAHDKRRSILPLTARGRETFADLDARASREISRLIEPLSGPGRARLADALGTAEELLGGKAAPLERSPDSWAAARGIALRPSSPGGQMRVKRRSPSSARRRSCSRTLRC